MRLVLVSNRLPFTVVEREGEIKFQKSVGGLASGLTGYLESLDQTAPRFSRYLWVGWPGLSVTGKKRKRLQSQAIRNFHACPLFFSERTMEKFYHGFCNKTIWPLFHYFQAYVNYDEDFWQSYTQVNTMFRDALLKILKPDDLVWIHDYQLMLLPKLLRERRPQSRIGFFLHIPFPAYEMFQLLPPRWSQALLEGMLGADLIGFHTHDYTQNFMRCVLRIAGRDYHLGRIMTEERPVRADVYPIGIDFDKFFQAARSPEVEKIRRVIQKNLPQVKIIFSVDRLDYTKGILNRLHGFARFLEKYPQWREKVVFNLVVVPSRTGVERYQTMKGEIDAMVGRLNGRFGVVGWTPVIYQYKTLSFPFLVARYASSDAALITPLRDGMNLVAKEYIASRHNGDGVLIISEMTGAAKELGEALIINPNDREQIADALHTALAMPRREQRARMAVMQKRLARYDVRRWADHFLYDLAAMQQEREMFRAKHLGPEIRKQLLRDYRQAKRRLLLLDYDGTLVPFAEDPQNARPTPSIQNLLRRLGRSPRNRLVLISGRTREAMERWFNGLPLHLVAEHGAWVRQKDAAWVAAKPLSGDWKPKVHPILEIFTDRLPGSFVEEKEQALVWHYRKADPELAALRAKELIDDLLHFSAGMEIEVVAGNKIVEIRSKGVDKGSAALRFLDHDPWDFILAIGDDTTDEDLFAALPKEGTCYSIRVGWTPSHARHHLRSPAEVTNLLKQLAK